MPRIAPIDPSHAPADVQATLTAVKAKIGMVPNLFKTFAHAPAVLNSYLAMSDQLGSGVLTARQREIVALAVAQANGCHYCLSAHTMMGKGAGLSAEAILDARRGAATEPSDAAVAALALAILKTRGKIEDGQLAAARAAGLDEAGIVEVVGAVAFNVLTNYMNNLAHTEIDFPKVEVELAV